MHKHRPNPENPKSGVGTPMTVIADLIRNPEGLGVASVPLATLTVIPSTLTVIADLIRNPEGCGRPRHSRVGGNPQGGVRGVVILALRQYPQGGGSKQ